MTPTQSRKAPFIANGNSPAPASAPTATVEPAACANRSAEGQDQTISKLAWFAKRLPIVRAAPLGNFRSAWKHSCVGGFKRHRTRRPCFSARDAVLRKLLSHAAVPLGHDARGNTERRECECSSKGSEAAPYRRITGGETTWTIINHLQRLNRNRSPHLLRTQAIFRRSLRLPIRIKSFGTTFLTKS